MTVVLQLTRALQAARAPWGESITSGSVTFMYQTRVMPLTSHLQAVWPSHFLRPGAGSDGPVYVSKCELELYLSPNKSFSVSFFWDQARLCFVSHVGLISVRMWLLRLVISSLSRSDHWLGDAEANYLLIFHNKLVWEWQLVIRTNLDLIRAQNTMIRYNNGGHNIPSL